MGNILRMGPDRMVHKATHHVAEIRSEGDLFMDVPDISWEELIELARNRMG